MKEDSSDYRSLASEAPIEGVGGCVATADTENERVRALTPMVERFARTGYGPREIFGYHSWHHILEMRRDIQELIAECLAAGVSVDVHVLDHAVLLHDLYYGVRYDFIGYSSAEELSASVAYRFLKEQGAPEEHAQRVRSTILATHHFVEPRSVEEVIIRAADLRNVSGDYATFRAKTEDLYREHCNSSLSPTSFSLFALRSIRYLALYAWRFLSLRSVDQGIPRVTSWHGNAVANLIALFKECLPSDISPLVSVQFGVLGDGLAPPKDGEFHVLCDLNPAVLASEAQKLRSLVTADERYRASIVVPGGIQNHALSAGSVDHITVYSPASLEAVLTLAQYALRPGGTITFIEPEEHRGRCRIPPIDSYRLYEVGVSEEAGLKLIQLQRL